MRNVDLVCLGVDYIAAPQAFHGPELLPPTSDEIDNLKKILGRTIALENIRILASGEKRFSIVASSFTMSENDWDIFESPFEFRSQFRASDLDWLNPML